MRESADELKRQLEEKELECDRYRRVAWNAIDKLTDLGVIDNLPHTKYQYATGQRELR